MFLFCFPEKNTPRFAWEKIISYRFFSKRYPIMVKCLDIGNNIGRSLEESRVTDSVMMLICVRKQATIKTGWRISDGLYAVMWSCLSLSHTHTHTHTHTQTHKPQLSAVMWPSLSLSLSHTHTHTHTNTQAAVKCCDVTLSLSLTRMHERTHAHDAQNSLLEQLIVNT